MIKFFVVLALSLSLNYSCKMRAQMDESSELEADNSRNAGEAATAENDIFRSKRTVQRIEITSADWQDLAQALPKGDRCNFAFIGDRYEWHTASKVVVNGKEFKDVGIKKRSFCGSFSKAKPSLAINFDKFKAANEDAAKQAFGIANLTLNNSVQDKSFVRQCLSYELFRKAGVVASRCNFATLKVNGKSLGIYVHVEPLKKAFFKSAFKDPLGVVYELSAHNIIKENLAIWEANKDDLGSGVMPSVEDIMKIVGKKDAKLEDIKKFVDVDQFINYWAMEIIVGHWDGFANKNNNSYFYLPVGGKAKALPWGLDQTFNLGESRANAIDPRSALAKRLYEINASKSQLHRRVWELVNKMWIVPNLNKQVDEIFASVKPVLTDEELEEASAEVASVKAFIKGRVVELKTFVPER